MKTYYFILSILPESPRWLLSKDRKDEALAILKTVAKTNKRELSTEIWNSLLETHNSTKITHEETALDALKSRLLCVMSVILFLNW